MINKKISIFGAGHMGKALVNGLMLGKIIKHKNLLLTNGLDNIAAAKWANVIIIAVKPKIVGSVAMEIKPYLCKRSIIISAAACVEIDLLERFFGSDTKIIRIMPNLSVAIGQGVIGWLGNKNITSTDDKLIRKLLGSLGYLIKCKDENMLEKLTTISGCGPAYVAFFISKLQKIAQRYGFTRKISKKIVIEIFAGTLQYLSKTGVSSEKFIKSISTKGGITEEIVNNLDKNNFYKLLFNSLKKGYDKIGIIRKELENDYL